MITVVIPVLNEQENIGGVVHKVNHAPFVSEVIVVDDKSSDATIDRAKTNGAKVIISTKIGKGASMRDGLLMAKNDIIVFLDGDIGNYADDIVQKLTEPILQDRADFVKATFSRQAGRVTELVAKPLLALLFPKLTPFSQPLSGMIAGRKEIFQRIVFEDDYGVDIGILIDLHLQNVRMEEANIGELENKMKSWIALGPMAREVARSILKRAGKLSITNLSDLETMKIIRDQMDWAIKKSFQKLKKMIIFDMDNTVLEGSFIEHATRKIKKYPELEKIRAAKHPDYVRTKLIAKLLKGLDISDLIHVSEQISIVPGTKEIIKRLKNRGYVVGIITDSYDCIANHVAHVIGADFTLANELEFSQSKATGEVKIPSFFMNDSTSICKHSVCKQNALLHIAEQFGILLGNIIVVGDGDNDLCMIKSVGVGVSFCSQSELLNRRANYKIEEKSFKKLLSIAR